MKVEITYDGDGWQVKYNDDSDVAVYYTNLADLSYDLEERILDES